MSQDIRPRGAAGAGSPIDAAGVDRLELHHRQQLSALVDGALAPDEARFLLRRLEHDHELAGSFERWQLYGQAMRGQLGGMASPGFAAAVAAAVREQPLAATGTGDGPRRGWMRWGGGGAALAASVAVVVLFMGQTRGPAPTLDATAPTVATASGAGAPGATPSTSSGASTPLAAAVPEAPAVAVTGPAPDAPARPSRRPAVQPVVREPLRAMASVPAPSRPVRTAAPAADVQPAVPFAGVATAQDPFASVAPLAARPWPRAALPQSAASGAFTARFDEPRSEERARPFYPFEPALPEADSPATSGPVPPAAPGVDMPSR